MTRKFSKKEQRQIIKKVERLNKRRSKDSEIKNSKIKDIIRKFGIHPATFYKWKRQFALEEDNNELTDNDIKFVDYDQQKNINKLIKENKKLKMQIKHLEYSLDTNKILVKKLENIIVYINIVTKKAITGLKIS